MFHNVRDILPVTPGTLLRISCMPRIPHQYCYTFQSGPTCETYAGVYVFRSTGSATNVLLVALDNIRHPRAKRSRAQTFSKHPQRKKNILKQHLMTTTLALVRVSSTSRGWHEQHKIPFEEKPNAQAHTPAPRPPISPHSSIQIITRLFSTHFRIDFVCSSGCSPPRQSNHARPSKPTQIYSKTK